MENLQCTVRFQLCVSYLKGLNVNRLLLAIVLAPAPPVIIFQKERPLTSLLTSHHGTSGDQTFSPRPIQQRCTAALTRVISHRQVSRRKNQSNFYSECPLWRLWKWGLVCFSTVRQTLNMRWSRCRLCRPLVLSPKFWSCPFIPYKKWLFSSMLLKTVEIFSTGV